MCQEKTSFYCDKMSFFILFILCMTFLTEIKGNEKNVFLAYIIKKNSSHYNMIWFETGCKCILGHSTKNFLIITK